MATATKTPPPPQQQQEQQEQEQQKQQQQQQQHGPIYIGCAGYNYAHWRKGTFYPRGLTQSEELRYYSALLPTCEINSTFYGLPRIDTCSRWCATVPEQFRFSLKVSRSMTHEARLTGIDDSWSAFFNNATQGLRHKLGPCLVQLPPSLHKDMGRLEALGQLVEQVSPEAQIAMEFRSTTWFCDEVFTALRARNWALVETVTPDGSVVACSERTADWTYARWHGVTDASGAHANSYSDEELRRCAEEVAERWRGGARAQYVFFLNDWEADAVKNAQTLDRMVRELLHVEQLVPGFTGSTPADTPKIDTFFRRAAPEAPAHPVKKPKVCSSASDTEAAASAPPAAEVPAVHTAGAGAEHAASGSNGAAGGGKAQPAQASAATAGGGTGDKPGGGTSHGPGSAEKLKAPGSVTKGGAKKPAPASAKKSGGKQAAPDPSQRSLKSFFQPKK